jgi:outer membrane lipoprotein-sorting protein
MRVEFKTMVLGIVATGGLLAATAWPQSDSIPSLPFTTRRALGFFLPLSDSVSRLPFTTRRAHGLFLALQAPLPPATSLDRVLKQMDDAARTFRSTQASVVWDRYDSVIRETETQTGKIYFRREGGEIQMSVEFDKPDLMYVIYSGGKVQVYQPKIDQLNLYDPGKNRGDVESFLVLGFGGAGHDLPKSYDLKFLGTENVDGVAAEQLELIPKSVSLRNNIARILLWIDPARGISVQQEFFEPGGNHKLAKYSDIKMNQSLPDNAFKLKTTKKTRVISAQG